MIDLDELVQLKHNGFRWHFIEKLVDSSDELIAMARRYQWLREHTVATGLSQWVHPHQFLDAAIDAAMQEKP